jgi:iron complex outermembrane receptor protein
MTKALGGFILNHREAYSMKKLLFFALLASLLLTQPLPVLAAEPGTPAEPAPEADHSMGSIVVEEQRIVTPTKQTNETVFTGTEITRRGIEAQGGKTAASVYEALNVLPGISVESVDPLGLSTEQKTIRVRGVRGYLGSMTVEGVPNYGGNPMGPRDYIYDTENLMGISVYKGAVPANLGTSVGARGGAIELKPRWPGEKPEADISQAFGSNAYSRTYMRVSSGALPHSDTRFSIAYSYTDAEKWKGDGKLGPRNNLNAMIVQPINDKKDEIKLFVNYNQVDQHLYRPLTYSESRSLSDNYRKDYNSHRTGKKSTDIDYYGNNLGSYINTDIFGVVPFTFDNGLKLSFKPYYSLEDSTIVNGSTSSGGVVQKRLRDIERIGLLSEVSYPTTFVTFSLGYLFESTDMTIATKNYNPSTMAFQGYGVATENDGAGYTHSPFLKLSGSVNDFKWQAGLKYFAYMEPSSKGYVSGAAPAYALVRAPDLDRDSKTYDALLPSLGLSYDITETVQAYANYGRTQIRPYSYVPLINTYNQNRTTFRNAGVTLADMFAGYEMEISDSFEFGVRYKNEWMEISPTVFYSLHQNLLTTVYDPRVNLSYQQNIGDATGYGFELETNFFLTDMFTVFVNPSYTSLTYDDDLTYQRNTLSSKGKQVVDTPTWMVKTGVIFSYEGFQIIPSMRYMSERYGDVEHHEKVDPQTVFDLRLSYTFKNAPYVESITASLDIYNLFDAKTISMINASDDNRAGSTSYYVGAPFTALFQLAAHF